MTEYLTLIQRAVDGLAKNNPDERRALYERARAALLAQLRSVEPALSGAEITKERLALEEAIHKVEAGATRKTLGGPRPEQRVASPNPRPFTPERSPAGPATALRRRPIPADDSPSPERAAPQRAQEPQRQEPQRQDPQRQDLQRQEPQRQEPQRQEPQRQEPQRQETTAQAATAPIKQTARSRILGARTTALRPDGLKGLRKINEADDGAAAAEAASTASAAPEARRRPPKLEGPTAAESFDDRPFDEHDALEPDHGSDGTAPARSARPRPRSAEPEETGEEHLPWRLHSYGNWVRIAVLLIVAGAVGAAAWQYRDSFAKVYHYVAQLRSPPANQAAQTTSPPPAKFSGRVPQEGAPGAAASVAGSTPASTQPAPQGAQHAVLLEQDPNDPQGKRFDGTVIWRTETVSPGPGLAPELEVHGDIAIPERHVTVTLSLRRNTDKALPASHTIQIMFNLPPNFPGEGVSSMPGIFAKASEQATGTPLAGISVKVTDNYFLLGLSADSTLQQRNVELLKDKKWFDIAIVYKNNTKAILAVERGPPGDRAFADAFSAWGE